MILYYQLLFKFCIVILLAMVTSCHSNMNKRQANLNERKTLTTRCVSKSRKYLIFRAEGKISTRLKHNIIFIHVPLKLNLIVFGIEPIITISSRPNV